MRKEKQVYPAPEAPHCDGIDRSLDLPIGRIDDLIPWTITTTASIPVTA